MSSHIFRVATAGVLAGILSTMYALTFASVIFSGPLSSFISLGIGFAFFGTIVMGALAAFAASYRGTISGIASEVALLGVISSALATGMVGHTDEIRFGTVVALICVASISVGVVYLALGTARVANLIRYVPFPVMGGFVAGVGWLLVLGALIVTTNPSGQSGPIDLASLLSPDVVHRWWPAAVLGFGLFLLRRKARLYLLPTSLVVAGAAFFGVAAGLGFIPSELLANGWLLGPLDADATWTPTLAWQSVTHADWSQLETQTLEIITFVIVMAVGALLVGASFEATLRRDIDINRDLRVSGWSNLLVSLGGGFPGYPFVSTTRLVHHLGAESRWTGVVATAFCIAVAAAGLGVIEWFPRMLAGALLFSVGFDLLVTWLVDTFWRLARSDYAIVLVVFAVVALFGFVEGVVVGMVCGLAFFAYNYSRIDIVSREFTGAAMHSGVSRPPDIEQLLRDKGDEVRILLLEGYIFFGTVNRLVGNVEQMLTENPEKPVRTIVLDFRRVCGLDSSAAAGFARLARMSSERHFALVICAAEPESTRLLINEGLREERRLNPGRMHGGGERRKRRPEASETWWIPRFPDLDAALEWCENTILERHQTAPSSQADVASFFEAAASDDFFRDYGESRTVRAGEHLIAQGDDADEIYFIVSGEMSVWLRLPNGKNLRVRRIGAGTAIGEVALYMGGSRTASVVADQDAVVRTFTRESLAKMRDDDPRLAGLFHEMMAKLLAHRLADVSRILDTYAN